jgi:uncharacterized membrane protein YphA (DoxX/SURF4 family)
MKYAQLFLRVVVGGVLVYAGFMKAVGPSAEFAALISAYQILPSQVIIPFSIALPYVEMWVGLFIFCGFYTRQASILAMLLFGTFFIALVSTFARGIDLVSCGCFGSENVSPRVTVILDFVLFSSTLVIYLQSRIPLPCSLDSALP